MRDIKVISAAKFFSVIDEILEHGQQARITVTGSSMFPFLREGIDSVQLAKCEYKRLRRGDIVLIKRTSGQYIMHRILRKSPDSFYIVGDAQQCIEGPLVPEQVIAAVSTVWRKEKRISCSNLSWKLLSTLWLILLPYRCKIIQVLNISVRTLKKHKRQL